MENLDFHQQKQCHFYETLNTSNLEFEIGHKHSKFWNIVSFLAKKRTSTSG